MGVIEKSLGKRAFLDSGSLGGATGGDVGSLLSEKKVRLAMEGGGEEGDADDRKSRTSHDEEAAVRQTSGERERGKGEFNARVLEPETSLLL
ncbi:hypothetical protein BaRGS_00036078, partial [Batillaria attramentaria]